MKKTKNKKNQCILIAIVAFSFLFSLVNQSHAVYWSDSACQADGGQCEWRLSDCEWGYLGSCYGTRLCCKVTQDTSGADPDPIGAGLGAGGTLENTNTGIGGAAGGTVTPGTSGISATSPPATGTAGTGAASAGARTGSTGGLVPCTDDCTLCHLVLGFKNIYDYLLTLLLVATTLVVVVAGVMYMVSSGNKGMLDKAKAALTYAITAMILALVAWLIINTTLNALGYNNAGNWWTFTCDTTQSAPQASTGAGGSTLPGNTPPSAPGTPGNCGGMSTTVQNQCVLASAALQSMLSCMSGKGATGTITSVTGSTVGGNFEKSKACCGTGNCPHASMTCHYGCGMSDQGYSHAVDVSTSGWSDDQLLKLASIAKECGSGKIWGKKTMGDITYWQGHGTHLHISTGACGH